jgi:hypothetical protein
LQDPDNACLIEEARANDLACPIEEARAPDVKGINSKNTIIVHIPEGSPVEGKSRMICIDFTSYIDLTALRRKDKIKARKVDGAELRDWLPRAFAESPYKLRSKLKLIVTKSIVRRTKFSNTIVKMAKAILVIKVELEFEQESE